jgi:hypothetical protein
MERKFVAVIEYKGKEVFRGEAKDQSRARIAIADWKASNPEKDWYHLRSWLETMSMPPYLPEPKNKRRADKSEQEKTVEKYLQ